MADNELWTEPAIVDDGTLVDDDTELLSYEERVQRAELQRIVARQTPQTEIRGPSISNAERYDMESERIRRERRRRQRRGEGRPLIEVDDRGVRGEQLAPALSPSEELTIRNEGRADVLVPYYDQSGRDRRQPMSTSWVKNIDWYGRIVNNIAEINLPRLEPRRVVTDISNPVLRTVEAGGNLGVGGEYALFMYELLPTDPVIESNRDDVIDIQLSAEYDGVARTVLPGGIFRLQMSKVHSYFETANEVPVVLRELGLVIQKQRDSTNMGLTAAVVDSPYYRHTFRKSSTTKQWLLVKSEWWVMRHQLMGISDKDRFLHWRVLFSVNGAQRDIGTFSVEQTEDAESNPLAPRIKLDLFPDVDDTLGGELELMPNEMLAFTVQVTSELKAQAPTSVSGRVGGTKWTELPGLSFRLLSTDSLLRIADKRDQDNLEIKLTGEQIAPLDARKFETSADGLKERDVLYSLGISTRRPGGYVLRSMSIGWFRLQSVYEALRDAQRTVD